MWKEWELKSPQVQLYLAIKEGNEEKIRSALEEYHREFLEYHHFKEPVGRGIYEEGVFMDTAILSGREKIVKLLLELGFKPLFFHGSGGQYAGALDRAVNREYYRESREIWERVTYYSEIGLKDMAPGRVVWPIADDNLFRMQIEAMEDINSIETIRIIKKEEERLIFPYGMQIEVTPVLFALLTGNRKRLCWLLSQGAKLDGGWPMWRERDLKPLLNPFGEEHNWCTNTLEIAILSGNPGMVEFVLEKCSEAAFYWAGHTVEGTGKRWFPKLRQCGRPPQERGYRDYRMERAINFAGRPMWDYLWGHFREPLSRIPIYSVLDMGGGAFADLLFERMASLGNGNSHMAELDRWAGRYLRWRHAPEYCEGIRQYFSRHWEWYHSHMEEAGADLRAFLMGIGWHAWSWCIGGKFNRREPGWFEFPELLAGFSVDISALLQWHISGGGFEEETVLETCVNLKQISRDYNIVLEINRNYIDMTELAETKSPIQFFTFINVKNRGASSDGLEMLKKVCEEFDELLPEPLVEAAFENNYLTGACYMEFLQYLESREKYDMITQFIRGNNCYALAETGNGDPKEQSPRPACQFARSRDNKEISAHRLAIYRALRAGGLKEEAGLLRMAGNPEFNGRLMEALRSSGGLILESRLRVRFWNQVCEFDGCLNLPGIAFVMGNDELAKRLLEFWSEREQRKCNPRSGFLAMEIFYSSRTNQGYDICVQYRKGGMGEWTGGIVTGEASLGADEEYHTDMTVMSLAALAIAMGRLEIVEEIDRMGLLSDQDIRCGIIYAGDARMMEYLNRRGRFTPKLWQQDGLGYFLSWSGCWNWFVLGWFAENGLMAEADYGTLREWARWGSTPGARMKNPVKKPCSEEYLVRKCEEALGGNVKLPGPGRTTA